MDAEYDRIYESLYAFSAQQLREPGGEAILLERFQRGREGAAIRRMIDDVAREGNYAIRPDAKYFLYVNFLHMIAVPTQVRGNIGLDDVEQYLYSDLHLLLRSAAEQRRGGGISGHAVLEAIASSWRQLKLSDLRIWGED